MQTVDEIYQNIAQDIVNAIDEDWTKAFIFVEIFEDGANFKGEYFINEEKKSFEVADEAFDDFENLYEITSENKNDKWNKAIFTLYSNGKFEIDFQYNKELADKLNKAYLKIKEEILSEIGNKNYTKVIVSFDYFGNAGEFDCIYKIEDKEVDFDVEYSMYKNFKKLHELTSTNDENRWNRVRFILFKNGKYDVEFTWSQEVEDEQKL